MKNTVYMLSLSFFLLITGCRGKETGQEENSRAEDNRKAEEVGRPKENPQNPVPPQSKASIQLNSSLVLAELINSEIKSDNDFTISVKLLEAESNGSMPSIAVKGETLKLAPALILDEKGMPEDNETNRDLLKLKELKAGQNFRAVISLEKDGRWIVSEVLNN